jgi:hypothetical protein
MHGIVFLDMWQSNSRSVNVIPDVKYLKNVTIIKYIEPYFPTAHLVPILQACHIIHTCYLISGKEVMKK